MDSELKNNGFKNTRQRMAIIEILEKSTQPVSAEEIFSILLKGKTSVSISTVYRALETMVSKEIVTKLNINGDSKALFELNRKIHSHHLVCLGCKKIISVMHCPLEMYEKVLADETGFIIAGHKLDVYGYCPECRSSRM